MRRFSRQNPTYPHGFVLRDLAGPSASRQEAAFSISASDPYSDRSVPFACSASPQPHWSPHQTRQYREFAGSVGIRRTVNIDRRLTLKTDDNMAMKTHTVVIHRRVKRTNPNKKAVPSPAPPRFPKKPRSPPQLQSHQLSNFLRAPRAHEKLQHSGAGLLLSDAVVICDLISCV